VHAVFRRILLVLLLAFVAAPGDGRLRAGAASAPATLLPVRGDAQASIVILLVSDFECPYCAQVEPLLKTVRETFPKDVQVVFKHNPLPIHPQAPLAHEAAVEAGRQGKFWEMHDLLFANQQKLAPADLETYARQLGLDMPAFSKALAERTHRTVVERDMREAIALGVTGTPTIYLNGRRAVGVPTADAVVGVIRSLLAGGDGSTPVTVPTSSFDLTGSPAKGPADAPITIVEYSDFQCGFCLRANATVAQVLARYGDKVRRVFKHFPLDFHKEAPLAHLASLAANEQGRFWEMHDRLFANQRALQRDDLLAHAKALGLDMARFTADLESPRLKAILDRDLAEGAKLGVEGTPTFFINGTALVGAQPESAFTAAIDKALAPPPSAAGAGRAAPPAVDVYGAVARGPADAPVQIQWFADLSTPLHRDALALLRRAVDAHPDDVRVVFRHAPAATRPEARLLHEAVVAAAEQGRFWELHDVLMQRPTTDRARLTDYAARLGLDAARFAETLESGRAADTVGRDLAEVQARDVRGTPTFFVNDTRLDGVVPIETLERAITAALSSARRGGA
jgi:protein-disulfide isomerase